MKILITEIKDEKLLESIFQEALSSSKNTKPNKKLQGCARVYIDIGKIRENSKLFKLINKHFKFVRRPHCSYKCIYVGYDNATGKEWTTGEVIQSVFHKYNISAILELDPD